MENNNGFLTVDEAKLAARRRVPTSSGKAVQIRRIHPALLIEASSALVDVAALVKKHQEGEREIQPAEEARGFEVIHRVLIAGVEQPPLSFEGDGLRPTDLPIEDQMTIFNAILDHSRFNKRAAEEVLPLSATGA